MWKISSLICILLLTLVAGSYPFIKRFRTAKHLELPAAEALAAGVFLGAGLLHMLSEASHEFSAHGYDYPLAMLLAGAMFLFLLWIEHLGQELHRGNGATFAILAAVMLSIHALFAGAALGLSGSFSILLVILIAILAHKWATSFALAMQISKSTVNFKFGLVIFGIYALMAPIGIIFGSISSHNFVHYPLLEPIFASLAAGTFIYLGTLHGLGHAVMVKKCCDLKHFSFVVLGFGLMAVVAIWG